MDSWDYAAELGSLWWSRHAGIASAAVAGMRLQSLVHHARAQSPLYRELYADLPPGDVCLERLPCVAKPQLMARFDDWCTDRQVTRKAVDAFLARKDHVGERFLGRYCAWKSSGTTGTPGVFLQDEFAMSVYDALVGAQCGPDVLGPDAIARSIMRSARAALVTATGDHFAAITSWQRVTRSMPAPERRAIPVTWPLERIAAELQAFDPAFLAGYPSVLLLLAEEQLAGRLQLAPALVWSGGEALAPHAKRLMERAFGCGVMNEYGASECLSLAYECAHGWMHANSEWVFIEPVDARGEPCAPGHASHTALVTNLANRVQPIIRYDLGDSLRLAAEPCACGDPRPAFHVQGRCDDVLAMRGRDGRIVRLVPLAVENVIEDAGVACRFQVVQTRDDTLRLRLEARGGARRAAWHRVCNALRSYLSAQRLANVRVALDACPPAIHPSSGKLHTVIRGQTSKENP